MFLEQVPLFRRPDTIPRQFYAQELRIHAFDSRVYIQQLFQDIRLLEYIREQVGWFADDPESVEVQILATGSDGRDEKATFVPGRLNGVDSFVPAHLHEAAVPSSMNVIAVIGAKNVSAQSDCIRVVDNMLAASRSETMALMERELMQLGLFEQMEVKSVYSMTPSGYLDDPDNSWPSRVFDTVVIAGQGNLDQELRKAYVRELQIPSRAKKLRKREADRAKQYRKVCIGSERAGHRLSPGMQYVSAGAGIVRHFDLDAGIAYYDRHNNIASFKYGPLRAVQMHTSLLLIALFCQSFANEAQRMEMAEKMPRSIVDKLQYLQQCQALPCPPALIQRICDNYQYFLRLYHQSEWESAAHNNIASPFASDAGSRQEVRERLGDVVKDVQALSVR